MSLRLRMFYPLTIFMERNCRYDSSGHVESIVRVTAGYGKVAVLNDLQGKVQVARDRIIYVGDGSSDIHVMLHVNRREAFLRSTLSYENHKIHETESSG